MGTWDASHALKVVCCLIAEEQWTHVKFGVSVNRMIQRVSVPQLVQVNDLRLAADACNDVYR